MAMIATAAAAPATSAPMMAGKPEAQEDAGSGFTDLMHKMSRKDDRPGNSNGQEPALAGPDASAGETAGAGMETAGDAAAPDLLTGLFELPAQTANGEPANAQSAVAQPVATQQTSAAALIAALTQSAGVQVAQKAPASSGTQGLPGPAAQAGNPSGVVLAEGLLSASIAGAQSGNTGAQPVRQSLMPSGPSLPSEASLAGLDDEGLISRILKTAPSEGGEVPDDADALRLAAGMGKMKVTREETHFAPSLRLSPVEQVGTAIASALGSAAQKEASGTDGAAAAAFRVRPDAPAVKVLEIQLQPMELGSVKVTMKLTGDAVDVVLTASNPDTAELLKQDRQLLDQMMRATGHKADSITIQAAGDDRPAFQVTGAQPGQGAQGQAGGDGRGAMAQGQFGHAAGGERGGQQQGGGQSPHGTEATVDGMEGRQHATADDGRSGALYL
jgi:flagellar hook-length control protein FliK